MDSPQADGSLQFDQAEYLQSQPVSIDCKACGRSVVDRYYDVNGLMFCGDCVDRLREKPSTSERVRRFARAAFLGSLAAFAGFLLYFVVLKVTGLQIGLISIVVAFLVGNAVHQGSRHEGGWAYQLLAIFLTYTAICASYAMIAIPLMLANPPGKEINDAMPADTVQEPGANRQPVAEEAEPVRQPPMSAPMLVLAFFISVIFLYAFPIVVGFSSPIGLLIIGFALWEAWKLNRRVVPVIQGPFALAEPPSGASTTPEAISHE